jgi:hypothetical protein
MSNWIDKVLTAYRPLYLRGLLMDGQYRLPEAAKKPPTSGKRLIPLQPAFEPDRRRVLVATATAAVAGLCTRSALTPADEVSADAAEWADTCVSKR